ncbi:MAG: hypothetical protein B6I20_04235 [Bacteroidetes bacterium 4572_117]|nr:MAG: hypothetical protein B6I20_04235 [Bacteroidetes bacterium 4572_117]
MSTWYECKVRYQKMDQNGKEKKVTEPYLVDAVSFTDAEKRIHEMMEPYISGEFTVTNIKIANYSELHPDENGDRWFKCKVTFVNLDEEKGVERKSNTYMLIQANDVKEAYDAIDKLLTGTVSDYEIPAIQESPIMDVFPVFDKNNEIPENLTPLKDAEDVSVN